ncbi:MAG: host-nuclease inhibitor Gam family protein [Zoogloeaceae bacterium]|jgi:phage host-nuclease inhibitor protein Gam|nr:host-nuclease inhibitor Gam family protein [Zoogloeaceae bacterium]
MTKSKKAAAAYVCQSKEEVMDAVRQLGDAQRELTRLQTEINDLIAAVVAERKDAVDALSERIDTLFNGIHLWCEANRVSLCGAKGKTANLITGEVQWRQRPPSVSIRNQDKVIESLRAFGLSRFIRVAESINKEAILAEPAAVVGIAGINVITGIEDFSVTPFEVEVAT